MLVIFADVVQCCHDRRSLLPVCFMWVGVLSVYVCAPCTLLVSLKGRQGRVPNPLTLKLQVTKPPCGCWELLFWHQLLLSKKILAYQTAEQGGNIPGPWYALLHSQAWVNKDCVVLGDRKALVLAAFSVGRSEKCRQTLGPSACCCPLWIVGISQMFGTVVMSGKDGCDLCIRLATFFRGTLLLLPRTSDGELWLFRCINWQLIQWVSPSLQGRRCCYGDK